MIKIVSGDFQVRQEMHSTVTFGLIHFRIKPAPYLEPIGTSLWGGLINTFDGSLLDDDCARTNLNG